MAFEVHAYGVKQTACASEQFVEALCFNGREIWNRHSAEVFKVTVTERSSLLQSAKANHAKELDHAHSPNNKK